MDATVTSQRLRALVAEDVPEQASGLVSLLNVEHEWSGCRVVASLAGVLEALGEEPFDVVLLDLGLADAQGIPVLEAVREAAPDLPIVVISGRGDTETIRAAALAGADDFLVKGRIDAVSLAKSILYARARRRSDRSWREAEERYRRAFHHGPHPSWIFDRETLRFLEVNEAAVRAYGYSREEFLERTILDVRPEEDVERLGRHLSRDPGEREDRVTRWRHVTKRGDVRSVDVASTALEYQGRPARLVVVTDVTEKVEAEERTAQSEARLRAIAAALPDLLFLIDRSGTFREVWGATELLSRPLEEVVGSGIADAPLPEAARAEHLRLVREALDRQEPRQLEYDLVVAGEQKFFEGRMAPVDQDQVVLVVRDVTQRKQLEEELRQSQKMEAVGRLAGGVAHDFNNLLTAITGYADLAWSQLPDGSPIRDDLDQVRQASERAGTLTRQLLAYSRRQVLQPKVLDLNAAARDLERMLSRVIGEDVRLATRLEKGLSPVLIDPGQLEQVILNLAVNARDAMPDGGELTISTRSLHLERPLERSSATLPAGQWVVLDVTDTGEGIPPDVHDRIFEPFFTTKPQGQGTGLGLATVYGIVKQSGGFVFFEPAPGRGTRFSILLPGTEGEPEARVSEVPAEPAQAAERILVIEDDAGVRRLVETTLNAAGYEVHAAASAEEALSLARSLGWIDVLVSDVILPDGRGPALEQELRQIYGDGFRTLYISGYAADQVDVEALRTTEFLGKPFTPSRLTATVRRILDPTEE